MMALPNTAVPTISAKRALQMAGDDFDVNEYYPAPFPDDVPIAELEKISLSKLLNGDRSESDRLFKTCTEVGFFYLDMLDHPAGRQLWRSACKLRQIGQDRLASTPMEQKCQFKPRPGIRVFDRGYIVRNSNESGGPTELELINIPQSEYFGTRTEDGPLPDWLSDYHETFKEAVECGNVMARAILSALEKPLQLPPGTLVKLHRLQDDSGDFARILRYAGDPTNEPTRPEGFPPHKDAQTVAILFAWIGGLQIPDPKIPVDGFAVKEEDWRWVKPEPGYAVVNLGDAMEIYTNKLLRSCIHRVFRSPGEQRPYDRYSILFATRPKNNSLMKAFESPVIPPSDSTEEPITSIEWGHRIIAGVQSRARARGARDLDNI